MPNTTDDELKTMIRDCTERGQLVEAWLIPKLTSWRDAYMEKVIPKPKDYTPPKDLPDHWGLTDYSLQRTMDNMAAAGWNRCIEAINQARKAADSMNRTHAKSNQARSNKNG